MMSQKTQSWLIAIGYVLFIYATLSVVRVPTNFLRERGLLVLSLNSLYGISVLILIFFVVKNKIFQAWRLLFLSLILLMYVSLARYLSSPEEQIHFFQYGLVGYFFFRALELNGHPAWKTHVMAIVLATLAGWVDELIQGVLPNRHYDIKDVFLNTASSALGAGGFFLGPRPKSVVTICLASLLYNPSHQIPPFQKKSLFLKCYFFVHYILFVLIYRVVF